MRSKRWLLLGIALAGGLALYGATQVWVVLELVPGAAAAETLEATGQQLNQSLSPVAIAAVAAALALSIAGKVFRRVLAVLVSLLGAGVGAIAWSVLDSPTAAASGRLAEATGLTGSSQLDLVETSRVTPFVAVTICAGILLVILGTQVLIYGARWKGGGRKYEADASVPGEARAARGSRGSQDENSDRIGDWDSMNDGEDPSEDPAAGRV